MRAIGIGSSRPLLGFGFLLGVREQVRMLGSRMTQSDFYVKHTILVSGLRINSRAARAEIRRSKQLKTKVIANSSARAVPDCGAHRKVD